MLTQLQHDAGPMAIILQQLFISGCERPDTITGEMSATKGGEGVKIKLPSEGQPLVSLWGFVTQICRQAPVKQNTASSNAQQGLQLKQLEIDVHGDELQLQSPLVLLHTMGYSQQYSQLYSMLLSSTACDVLPVARQLLLGSHAAPAPSHTFTAEHNPYLTLSICNVLRGHCINLAALVSSDEDIAQLAVHVQSGAVPVQMSIAASLYSGEASNTSAVLGAQLATRSIQPAVQLGTSGVNMLANHPTWRAVVLQQLHHSTDAHVKLLAVRTICFWLARAVAAAGASGSSSQAQMSATAMFGFQMLLCLCCRPNDQQQQQQSKCAKAVCHMDVSCIATALQHPSLLDSFLTTTSQDGHTYTMLVTHFVKCLLDAAAAATASATASSSDRHAASQVIALCQPYVSRAIQTLQQQLTTAEAAASAPVAAVACQELLPYASSTMLSAVAARLMAVAQRSTAVNNKDANDALVPATAAAAGADSGWVTSMLMAVANVMLGISQQPMSAATALTAACSMQQNPTTLSQPQPVSKLHEVNHQLYSSVQARFLTQPSATADQCLATALAATDVDYSLVTDVDVVAACLQDVDAVRAVILTQLVERNLLHRCGDI